MSYTDNQCALYIYLLNINLGDILQQELGKGQRWVKQ